MAIFGAQGIRDATIKSYHKYAKRPLIQGIAMGKGIPLHQFCLYGALSSRYLAGFNSIPEEVIWAELAPFIRMEPDDGLAALTEYIVYKEMPVDAKREWLSHQIETGLSLLGEEERKGIEIVAEANRFAWTELKAPQRELTEKRQERGKTEKKRVASKHKTDPGKKYYLDFREI